MAYNIINSEIAGLETTMTYITETQATNLYDYLIDECSPLVRIGDLTYLPSRVLKTVDPIAYRCGLLDYLDGHDLTTDEDEASAN